jgi:hypothetical protein
VHTNARTARTSRPIGFRHSACLVVVVVVPVAVVDGGCAVARVEVLHCMHGRTYMHAGAGRRVLAALRARAARTVRNVTPRPVPAACIHSSDGEVHVVVTAGSV